MDNLELLLKISLQASTPEMARVITEITVLTAGYNKHIAPLLRVVPLARLARVVGADGSAVVVLTTDYLIYRKKYPVSLLNFLTKLNPRIRPNRRYGYVAM